MVGPTVTLRSWRRGLALASLAVLALVSGGLPAPAFGHAVLEGTDPAAGGTLARQPDQIVFRFSEPVEANFGAIEIFDGRSSRVEQGEAFHPSGRGPELATKLRPELADGTYTATYRVMSADGHPVSGGLVFSIGKPSAGGRSVSQLLAERSGTGLVTDIGFGVARGLQYAAIAIAIGSVFFMLAIWLPALGQVASGAGAWQAASEAFASRIRKLLVAVAAIGFLSGAAGIVFQGATAAGISFWSALDSSIWTEVVETRFGTIWSLRMLVWILLGVSLLATLASRRRLVLRPAALGATGLTLARRPGVAVLAAVGGLVGFLALSPALAGHAGLEDPVALMVPANVLHVLAVSVWVAGLVLLLFAVPAATRRLEPADRTRLLAGAIVRFSFVAGIAVAVLLATGITQSLVEVRSIDNLIDTAFGRAVLIKICLFVLLVAIGAYNRRRLVPLLRRLVEEGGAPRRAGVLLRRALRAEVALVVAVLGVTAALVSYAPSTAVSEGGPVSITRSLGPADLQLTVDPARVGPNEMHVFLINKRDGSQFAAAKEFRLSLTQPEKRIGPLRQSVQKAGPGHWVMDGASFPVSGDWKVRVEARVSEFDAYYADLEVPVR